MKKHVRLFMMLIIAGGLLIAAALAGCGPDTSAPVLQEEVAQLETEDDELVTTEQDDTGDTDVGTGADTIALVEFTDQACLDCHTNQALLEQLAVEEEDVGEALSEGPG